MAKADSCVVLEDMRAVVVRPFSFFRALLATIPYGVVLAILHDEGFPANARNFEFNAVVFAIATVLWLGYLVKLRRTTIFDPEEGRVTVRNLLWAEKTLLPDDITALVEVVDGRTSYFKIAPRRDRFGKGYRFTRSFSGADERLIAMRATIIPAIEAMMGIHQNEVGVNEISLERPKYYSRRDGQFTRRFWRRSLLFLVIYLPLIASGIMTGNVYAIGVGSVLLFLCDFLPTSKIVFDTDEVVVRVYNFLGLRLRRSIPFSAFISMQSTRHSYNFIYVMTTLSMVFEDPHKDLQLGAVYFTGSLTRLADETEAIIRLGEENAGMQA
ncbi:MAG: hypothetical protein LUE17_16680 [Planctomycetaceae bacterium]|nr:hypothetical protein [Planctomycetaceae bacterium]